MVVVLLLLLLQGPATAVIHVMRGNGRGAAAADVAHVDAVEMLPTEISFLLCFMCKRENKRVEKNVMPRVVR